MSSACLSRGGGGHAPQKILKTRTPEMPFPVIWEVIFSAKIAIDDDLIINLEKHNWTAIELIGIPSEVITGNW